MSQHLINDFINRSYSFKPLNDAKIANHKLKKYQESNRKNNVSPEQIEESTHSLHKIEVKEIQAEEKQEVETKDRREQKERIDVTV